MFAAALMLFATIDADAVSVQDRFRFPFTAEQTAHAWRFASGHVAWARQHADRFWVADAEWRCSAWDKLDNCLRVYRGNDRMIMQELRALRTMIGAEAFWRGEMPDFIPAYRFRDR